MPRHILLCLLYVPLLALAAAPQDELAYSLGVQLGERLHQELPEIKLEDLLQGLQHGYLGQPKVLSGQRMQEVLSARDALEAPENASAKADEQAFLAKEKARPGVRELAAGVLVSELRAGTGSSNPKLQQAKVSYRLSLADGSVLDAEPSGRWFRLETLIGGWQIALRAMPQGARWRVVIPSALAYGAEGSGAIPGYAPLVFEIDLQDSR